MRKNKAGMKIYISGQITGMPIERARLNFADARARMEEEGYVVVSPLDNGLPIDSTWEEHMKEDVKMLMDCDAIYLMSNWKESKGARIERDLALALGYYVIEQEKQSGMEQEKKQTKTLNIKHYDNKTKFRDRQQSNRCCSASK